MSEKLRDSLNVTCAVITLKMGSTNSSGRLLLLATGGNANVVTVWRENIGLAHLQAHNRAAINFTSCNHKVYKAFRAKKVLEAISQLSNGVKNPQEDRTGVQLTDVTSRTYKGLKKITVESRLFQKSQLYEYYPEHRRYDK